MILIAVLLLPAPALGYGAGAPGWQQEATGTIRGVVTLEGYGPVAGALILLTDIGASTRSDDEGAFELTGVAAGTHEVVASRPGVGSARATITVVAGEIAEVDFTLDLQGRQEEVTVTATATGETTAFDTFNSVSTVDSVTLAKDMSGSLGEVLENEPGLAKRGFGAGGARPIIRGFDGDRVLILDNGVRTGDLSSQSGDHGTTIDPANVDRVEVVRGPATLLYGSNAIGGVVNAVTPDETFRTTRHEGLQVNGTADGGSANDQLGGNVNFTWAESNWMFWGGAGSRRTEDYSTPIGVVENSQTALSNGRLGAGYFGDAGFVSAGYKIEDGAYGVPEAEEFLGLADDGGGSSLDEQVLVDLESRRQSLRFDVGLDDLSAGFVDSLRLVFNAIDWGHHELERFADGTAEVGTVFDNRTYVVRAELEQAAAGTLHGKLGAWYQNRDYAATGEEALSPPVVQNALAGFVYEEFDFTGWRLQFGGRLEWNDYAPEPRETDEEDLAGLEAPDAVPRSFAGVSGSVGVRVDLAANAAFVANATSAYRAPALEELYNFGPHVGNLTFEIGDPTLENERSNGIDVSLRHSSRAVQASANFFYYDISDFIFVDFTGDVVDGLRVGEFTQGDSRFVGIDGSARARLHRHLILEGSIGFVDAELDDGTPLPRIPPVRGRIRVEIPYDVLRFEPEVILAAAQTDVPPGELSVDGYTVWNLGATYTLVTGRAAHIFSVKGYNLSNELYFNATSFIRIPEIGRGVKFGYALRLF